MPPPSSCRPSGTLQGTLKLGPTCTQQARKMTASWAVFRGFRQNRAQATQSHQDFLPPYGGGDVESRFPTPAKPLPFQVVQSEAYGPMVWALNAEYSMINRLQKSRPCFRSLESWQGHTGGLKAHRKSFGLHQNPDSSQSMA